MKLNQLFKNHMVFDAGNPIRVFGTGAGTVTVNFHGKTRTQTFAKDAWLVELPAEDYGGPYELQIDLDGELVTLTDVYVGEVYLLAGQSNMQFKLKNSATPRESYVRDDRLRCFFTERPEEGGEFYHPADGWVICDPESAGEWSAIGYHFAREIAEEKNVAVGLVTCYQGASVIQSWLPEEIVSDARFFVPSERLFIDHQIDSYVWKLPSYLYHFAFEGVLPFAFHAVLWYQGESNASDAESLLYGEMLAALICRWRSDLMQPDLPFVVVQLADYVNRNSDAWHRIQKAQAEIAGQLPHVVSVVSRDICERDDIHPKTKHLLAHRIVDALR